MATSPSTSHLHGHSSSSSSGTMSQSSSRSFQGTAGPYIQNNFIEEEEEEVLGAVGGVGISYPYPNIVDSFGIEYEPDEKGLKQPQVHFGKDDVCHRV